MRATDFLPAIVIAACTLAFLIGFNIKVKAQPHRLALADLGKQLLARKDVSPKLREHVVFCLDHAFGLRTYLLLTLPVLPVIAIWYVFKFGFDDPLEGELSNASAETKALFRKFDHLDTRLFFANNPFLVRFGFGVIGATVCLAWLLLFCGHLVRILADGMGKAGPSAELVERVMGFAVLGFEERVVAPVYRLGHT